MYSSSNNIQLDNLPRLVPHVACSKNTDIFVEYWTINHTIALRGVRSHLFFLGLIVSQNLANGICPVG